MEKVGSTYQKQGFTIVELLIVVVVIAILAAITIVSYTAIQGRAKAAAAQSSASQAARKVAAYAVTASDSYPVDKAAMLAATDLKEANGVSYQYSVSSDLKTYCLTTTVNNISYYTSTTDTSPVSGACTGHGANGAVIITNMVTNPSVEANPWGFANGATGSRVTGVGLFGTYAMSVNPASANSDSGVTIPVGGTLNAGTPYTASATVKAIAAGTYSLTVQGTAGVSGSSNRDTRVLAAGQTARFTYTWTPSATGGLAFYVVRAGTGTQNFYVDGAMVTQGSIDYPYADGSTLGWSWNGTTDLSTSTGPSF
jgi:prepilin-type N-terminal cleavage/methylation domain-containing protein